MSKTLTILANQVGATQADIDSLKGNGILVCGINLDSVGTMDIATMRKQRETALRASQGVQSSQRSDAAKQLSDLIVRAWQQAVKQTNGTGTGAGIDAPKATTAPAPKVGIGPVINFPATSAGNLDRALTNFAAGATREDWDGFLQAVVNTRTLAKPQPRVPSKDEVQATELLALVPAKNRAAAEAKLRAMGQLHAPYVWQAGRDPAAPAGGEQAVKAATPAQPGPVDRPAADDEKEVNPTSKA